MQTANQRNKELNNAQLEVLRALPQYLYLNQTEFILYNLVDKASNSGIFKNERLLVLNIRQQTLSYLSKVPNGLIPFYTEEEVDGQIPKERIFQHQIFEDQVNKFTCKELEEKNGIQIKLTKKDKKVEWVFYFKNKDIMKEWYRHIETVFTKSRAQINEKYHKIPHQSLIDASNDKIDPNINDQPQSIKNSRIHSQKEFQTKSPQKQKQPLKEEENELQSNLSELQKSPQIDKQSSFNEFSEHTPLGSFVRNNPSKSHYDTSPQAKNRQPGGIYSTTPKHSQRSITAPVEKPKEERSYRNLLDDLKNKEDSYFKDYEEDAQLKKSERSLIRHQFESRSINSKNDQSARSGSIRKNRPQIMKQYPKHPFQSLRNKQIEDEDLDSYKPIEKSPNFRSKSNEVDQSLKWNRQYYSRHSNHLKIYFTFVKECWGYLHQMIDELPLSKILQTSEKVNNYYIQHCNGIEYKIAFEKSDDESLIYELSQDTPIVANNYDLYDSIRREFFNQKSIFFRSQNDCPPLIALFDYRGLPVLCTAADREGIYNKKIRIQRKATTDLEDLLLQKMESLSLHITSSTDLSNFMRKMNTSQLNWAYLFKSTKVAIFKKIFVNEMFSQIFHNILRSELCHIYSNFPIDQFDDPNTQLIDEIVLDCALMMINRLFGSGKETQVMWSIILKECERRYSITSKKENLLSGYLLYAVLSKVGLELNQNVKISNKLMMNDKNATLEKSYVKGFRPIVHSLNYEYMSNLLLQMTEILDTKLSNRIDNDRLTDLLIEYQQETPEMIDYLKHEINLKLSETFPYKSKQANEKQLYDIITCDQPSFEHYQTAATAVRWSLLNSQINQASDISFIKIEEILFWVGRIPIICHFFDIMADYYIGNGDFESGIQQVKRSIQNLVEIFGLSSLPVLERRNKLCEIYLQINRREDCLKELYECKSICDSSGLKHHPIYLNTLIKISKLTLTLSKFNDSINNSLESLKFLQKRAEIDNNIQNEENAKEFLEISELLLRSFELTNRREELFQIGHLCLERCQNVDSVKTCKRMFKVLFFPYLKRLNLKQSQCLLSLLQELQTIYKNSRYSEDELYECIRKKRLMFEIDRKMQGYFKNLCVLYDQMLKRKILLDFSQRYLESLSQEVIRNQPLSLAIDMFLIGNLIGISYFQALLKDVYYQ